MTVGQLSPRARLDQTLRSIFKTRFGRNASPSEMEAVQLIAGQQRGRPQRVAQMVKERLGLLETPAAIWFNVHPRKEAAFERVKPRAVPYGLADGYLLVGNADQETRYLLPVVRVGQCLFCMVAGSEEWRPVDDGMRFVLQGELSPREHFDSSGRLRARSQHVALAIHAWAALPEREGPRPKLRAKDALSGPCDEATVSVSEREGSEL